MTEAGKQLVRNAVTGADRPFRVVKGGRGSDAPPPSDEGEDDPCPVTPLGDRDGKYFFLDPIGQVRELAARDLCSRAGLMSLFRGTDTWLRRAYPLEKDVDDGAGGKVRRTVDFRVNEAGRGMIAAAAARGLFGARWKLRRAGVWQHDGKPVVHCGDEVLINSEWQPAGARTGDQIWIAAEATPRPETMGCDHRVAVELQHQLQDLWCYRNASSAVVLVGLLYSAWLCGALSWRCNAFITGPSGSGKSAMRRVLCAALPVHDYSNDTSKAGIEQTISGRAIPAIIDEAADRARNSGRDLIDIVLSASSDEGTKLARGTSDGKGRAGEVLSSVIMFSINPPELEAQHLNRFSMIELEAPQNGADHTAEHAALSRWVKAMAPALWGRAIGAWDRYERALPRFRAALREKGCDPRAMDGLGSLAAGWFVMTHEGDPSERDLLEGVAALGEFVVGGQVTQREDSPRRVTNHLLASQVMLHRTSEREQIGTLLDRAFGVEVSGDDITYQPFANAQHLQRYGIRPIRACRAAPDKRQDPCRCPSCFDQQTGKPIPRRGQSDGVWIATTNPELVRLFSGTPFDQGRWKHELMRLPSALSSGKSIRIGGASGFAIWLERGDLRAPDDG